MEENNTYLFEQDWFSHNIPSLDAIFNAIRPQKILEIGSYEGFSSCWFIEKSMQFHENMRIFCVDTWEGGREHIGRHDMNLAEKHFDHNIQLALARSPQAEILKIKSTSHHTLMTLCTDNYLNYFDFIYIDGSHEAPDVLLDALLAHKLVRVGGVIAFDDYLWSPLPQMQDDHYLLVKPAVDHYVNTYQRKLTVIQGLTAYQLYVQKLAD